MTRADWNDEARRTKELRSPNESHPLRQKVNRHETKQKVRNKNRRPRIIFGHSLTKEESQNGNGGNDRAVEGDHRIMRGQNYNASNRTKDAC